MIIGLTGGIGSGKTTVANFFIELGIDIVDADIVAREVVEPNSKGLSAIIEHFGSAILADDGTLNRAELRTRIFSNEADKQWLNQLLHPLIREQIFAQLGQTKSPYKLLIAPLLIENGLHEKVDRVLVVDIPKEQQLARTLKRDNSSTAIIENIINSQVTREQRLTHADDIVDNSGTDLTKVKQQVAKLHQKYLTLITS